ncbi:MAG: DUF2087 domain-containing protein [Clostridiales bacterium]|nr:DUF2087 domain-containing protein [Clostridiales bacterium]
MDLEKRTIEELKQGYVFLAEQKSYACLYCGKGFSQEEVFPVGEAFYMAQKAVQVHVEKEHGGPYHQLSRWESKYNTLTENQKQLMDLFFSGEKDGEIAKILGVTTATVRRQKFTFREKAKQAKLYLALYDQVFKETREDDETMIPIHDQAINVDDRYIITKQEQEQVMKTAFESLSPLKLKHFPVKEKKKIVILETISKAFDKGKTYSEKEVNAVLLPIYEDYVMIRRYLIMYGYMDRKADGSSYWLT